MEAKQSRGRSPNYPRTALKDAVETVRSLHKKSGRASIAPLTAVTALGYKGMNGAALGAISTLSAYGLISRERGGNLTISELALKILFPPPSVNQEDALKQAALLPPVFASLHAGGFADCDVDVIKNHLVHQEFTAEGAEKASVIFKANCEFAKIRTGDIVDSETSEQANQVPPPPAFPFVMTLPQNTPKPQITPASQGATPNELPIPLEDGRVAKVPFPMTEESFDLLLGTLQLWKKRLVRTVEPPSEA